MAIVWSGLRKWDADALSRYAATVSSAKQMVDAQIATLQARRTSFQGEGATADALRNAIDTAHKELGNLAQEMQELHSAITKTIEPVRYVRSLVEAAQSSASAKGCIIGDDGSVSSTRPVQSGVPDKSSEVEPLVRKAFLAAEQADTSFAALIAGTGKSRDSLSAFPKGGRPWSKVEEENFKAMTPEARAAYWSKLPYAQKQYLCDNYPEVIGNADGVEAWARDRANRINIKNMKAGAEHDEKMYNDLYERSSGADRERYKQLRDRAHADVLSYSKIQEKLVGHPSLEEYQKDGLGDPVSLLVLQDDGVRVKAALAQGDIDHAKNIATVVPGIGTTVDGSLGMEMQRGENLRNAAAAEGNIEKKDVAVVSWLGYDAPGPVTLTGENLPDITTTTRAEQGSDRLAGFLTGIHSSREYGAGDAHMTLLGHSYGSTTSGMAATKVKPGVVDDILLFGSPGMGTYDPAQINVPEGHRFVLGVPVGDGVQGVGSVKVGDVGGLGENPMYDSSFIHLSDDATGFRKYDKHAYPSEWHRDFSNHSVYMEPGTQTLSDMGRIVAGGRRQLIGAPTIID